MDYEYWLEVYEERERAAQISASTVAAVDQMRMDLARPMIWLCQSCGWIGDDAELLRALNPFDQTDMIVGCPKCKAVDDMINACDEPGCTREATCGFPEPGGYRRTCGEHMQLQSNKCDR